MMQAWKLSSAEKEFMHSCVKYLGVLIDENLNWLTHKNQISTKLIRAKLQHFVNKDILLSLYYAIFHWHLGWHI